MKKKKMRKKYIQKLNKSFYAYNSFEYILFNFFMICNPLFSSTNYFLIEWIEKEVEKAGKQSRGKKSDAFPNSDFSLFLFELAVEFE